MSENNTNEDSMESHSPSFSEPTELKRGCDNCCKVSVCKSYLTTAMFEQQFIEDNKNIQKLPMKATQLALSCTEYLPIVVSHKGYGQ